MQGLPTGTVRWLLFSDLHFKHHDLNRVWQTAKWIVAEAERHQVRRVVVCGDLLTSRTMQPTHVLSTCYRFIGLLSDIIPHVHILLGNHDLAYRRDYQTTALDAFNLNRLAPYVSIHKEIAQHEWDGRRVILLPFREDQSGLTDTVASLSPTEASKTVAFAHLAINKAITQRYVVGDGFKNLSAAKPITYNGLTDTNKTDLRGSITYLGSPLQLNWSDLYDEKRGILLFDPETLKHEMLINPYVIGYTTVNLQEVLNDQANEEALKDKHVMLLGDLSHLKYVMARDKLLSLGAQSVRDWNPTGFKSHSDRAALGPSVPASDASFQPLEEPRKFEDITGDRVSSSALDYQPRANKLDFAAEAREYITSLELDSSLSLRQEELIRVGQRMIQVSRGLVDQDEDEDLQLNYEVFLDRSTQAISTRSATDLKGASNHTFAAVPSTLTITNFLSVQNTITIDFRYDLARGLTFLVGENGSGKSMLIEAMVWCQFGQCVRSGMAVDDVVNDIISKNCCVTLKFANGYAISRHRKHKENGNRVIVLLHGEAQLQYNHPDKGTTQEAIVELLGINYETYIKTVVLSHESAASFLSSKAAEKRKLTEAALGMSILDTYGKVSRLLLKDVDENANAVEKNMQDVAHTMEHTEKRIEFLDRKRKTCEMEAYSAAASLELRSDGQFGDGDLELSIDSAEYQQKIAKISALTDQISMEKESRQRLENEYTQMRGMVNADFMSWLVGLKQKLGQKFGAVPADRPSIPQRLLCAIRAVVTRGAVGVLEFLISNYQAIDIKHQQRRVVIDGLCEDIKDSKLRLQSLHLEVTDIIHRNRLATSQALRVIDKRIVEVEQAQKTCADQEEAMIKRHEAATYTCLIEAERSSLHSISQRYDKLALKLRELAADREVFAFWSSALTIRNKRTSSAAKSRGKSTANFREYVLEKSISDLNRLLAQILTALYDDTRHTNAIATGMLSSLFDSESIGTMEHESCSPGPVLDQSLDIHHSLAYGKRSGGERKRLDLALFFALLHLGWAESAHRAHYLLIDEVFDSLDEAGQEAVVRWCMIMLQSMVSWIVMVTHSRFLAERDPERDAGKAMVMRIRMGSQGTELVKDGQRIGI
ncbi:P-loop containing nucleoside triphosphate hydrolase protein [Fusarium tricinctum]|uniref:P-loop containing nucleoside triphosphate hydrolase protein n=1 Tax=Fusarium tricinctum TaxID=61284 RepID=A0A8K0RLT0_9HYPO|nr:P-loop containing nucleoside triphosphate hydrolase protein [Fusarium tricinctum]